MGKIQKEYVIAVFEVPSQHSSGQVGKDFEKFGQNCRLWADNFTHYLPHTNRNVTY